ncbi:MAG: hypothetical protein HY819_09045 [Acidobacteria bacterium]|nr:hypothetical protein [Acidobacteriota bacterium]
MIKPVIKINNIFFIFLSIFFVFGLFLNSGNLANAFVFRNLHNAQENITEEKAISLAEEFIIKNGYTNLAPGKEITPELLDKLVSPETVMKLRHNSLEPKAYGVIRKRRSGEGWTIVFQRKPEKNFDPKNGRGVSMNLEGKNLYMEPRDFLLSSVDKKLQVESK